MTEVKFKKCRRPNLVKNGIVKCQHAIDINDELYCEIDTRVLTYDKNYKTIKILKKVYEDLIDLRGFLVEKGLSNANKDFLKFAGEDLLIFDYENCLKHPTHPLSIHALIEYGIKAIKYQYEK